MHQSAARAYNAEVVGVVTVATLNLWGSSGDWRGRMDAAAAGLAGLGCDLLLVQEVFDEGAGGNAHRLAEKLCMEALTLDTGEPGFGLGILSKGGFDDESSAPLTDNELGPRRWMLSARPAGLPLWCHSVHLSHGLIHGPLRETQLLQVQKVMERIGGDELHLLGGDMNAVPESDEMRFLRGLSSLAGRRCGLQDAWLRHHPDGPDGITWCMERGAARRARTRDVDQRLDYLFVGERRKDGRGTILDAGRALVPGEDVETVCSDHCAVWARVQL